jgi:H/ACA ribonucleoprotein complex subunit 4
MFVSGILVNGEKVLMPWQRRYFYGKKREEILTKRRYQAMVAEGKLDKYGKPNESTPASWLQGYTYLNPQNVRDLFLFLFFENRDFREILSRTNLKQQRRLRKRKQKRRKLEEMRRNVDERRKRLCQQQRQKETQKQRD